MWWVMATSVKSFQPKRSEVHSCHYHGSSGEPCQFLSKIALAVCSEIDSRFFAALWTFPIRTFEDKSLRIEPVWFRGLCPLHMSHLLYKCMCIARYSSHVTCKIKNKITYSEILRNWNASVCTVLLFITVVKFSLYVRVNYTKCIRLPAELLNNNKK